MTNFDSQDVGPLGLGVSGFQNFDEVANKAIYDACVAMKIPADYLKGIVRRESSGDWVANARTSNIRPQSGPLLPYIGVFQSAAYSRSASVPEMKPSLRDLFDACVADPKHTQAEQIMVLAGVTRSQYNEIKQQDKTYNWLNVASYHYSGNPKPSDWEDEIGSGTSTSYVANIKTWWQQLDAAPQFYVPDVPATSTDTPPVTSPPVTTPATLTFGKVPFPPFVDRQSVVANKPEGVGWSNLGQRHPRFVVLHRMLGTLTGTDGYFPQPGVAALTDYGLGTANVDGANLDGVIYQWTNPRGYRMAWASGPVSAPYGDGLKWLNWGNAHGYDNNMPNLCGVSIENSGDYNDPMTDKAFAQLAAFVAYWFDQFQVPWDKAPIGPDGISCITWHQEWTIGTGKVCPGDWLMNNTNRLISAAAAIMKPYQTGTSVGETESGPSVPVTVPTPVYAKPKPIDALAAFGKSNADGAKDAKAKDGTKFIWVYDDYKVIKETRRRQYADGPKYDSVPAEQTVNRDTGPHLKVGEKVTILWRCTAVDDKRDYGITSYWTRVLLSDLERLTDTPQAA
ncbi:MAG TPA: N-acetylmuramoyl-L-alanine amidase [Thermomicrobiales bacterium]|nr:N-acetylmuramoyl-L-alanine amidase [Thermomicrobiales bacterium]